MVIDDYSMGEADQRLALGTGHSRRLHNSSTNGSSSRIIEEQQFVNGVIYHHNLNLNESGTGTGRSHDAIGLVPTGHCIR
ncbi:unnamed protein product [Anisakis simplex]|uniref:Uncharacterized protein n=1 Tax=Anisakis simplex TaxID=6269 RepID=A0A0M3JM35_ANISI|nr:unnamed protein product [Anisakis simplex]